MGALNSAWQWLERLRWQRNWICNVCGARNQLPLEEIDRESGNCHGCGSVMRFRSIVAVLTERLTGRISVLAGLPVNKQITGLGMSDAHTYAERLAEKFAYTNTYYHCDPLLDIVSPDARWLGVNDFVITSDVYEHVPPPIQQAFDNLFALLKPGGVVVFSVPFLIEPETREHYPELYRYSIEQDGQGEWLLRNTTREGREQVFRNLVFHGGPGSTLELRVFSLEPLKKHFAAAGFVDLRVHAEPCYRHGIHWKGPWSITLSALRPPAAA